MMASLVVDLRRPPEQRWVLPDAWRDRGRRMAAAYQAPVPPFVEPMARRVIPEELLGEIEGLARTLSIPFPSALLANLVYDLAPLRNACTAFAVATPEGLLHARNLDYGQRDGLLDDNTMVTLFQHGPEGPFVTVGWPGFVGALSGVAPGRFALSLNTCHSGEAPQLRLGYLHSPTLEIA